MKKNDIIYGINPILESLRSKDRTFNKIYILKGRKDRAVNEIVDLTKRQYIPLYFENRQVLNRIAGSSKHQGVIGIVSKKIFSSIDDILRAAKERDEEPFILILDNIEDPGNIGAIIRTSDAVGVHGIIIPERRCPGITNITVKTSAGAVEHIKISRVVNIANTIDMLKGKGIWIYGMDITSQTSYTTTDYKRPLAIVSGNEGKGIRRLVLDKCDERISIPLKGKISSLNVSVAVGIVLYEVIRQRDNISHHL
ncbi:MAG: 23S rRNA (guanosine(2251)-2'-O)-methyltransferase RlmB [Nitrospirota bacterium]